MVADVDHKHLPHRLLLEDQCSVDSSLLWSPGVLARDAIEALTRRVSQGGAPAYLRSDNSPEVVAPPRWTVDQGASTASIDPGNPWQSASKKLQWQVLR